MIPTFVMSDFRGNGAEEKVWHKMNQLLPAVKASLRKDPDLREFAGSAYVSRYWKRGSSERRFPWIGFTQRAHLAEFGRKEVCVQYQFGPTFWSIWIDYPASAARHAASDNLEEYSDSSLRSYFNDMGSRFEAAFNQDLWVALYPHPRRTTSRMNEFERRLYGREIEWWGSMSELDDRSSHDFAIGIKQPITGVYVGAEPSASDFVELSKKGKLVEEILRMARALLPMYLFMVGTSTPKGLKESESSGSRKPGGRGGGGGHILDTGSIDESAKWAVEKSMKYERDEGRVPEDVSSKVVHYDIESRDKDGVPVRLIEVKGRRSHIPVVLTKDEYKTAREKGAEYFLYVITGDNEGYVVQDPANVCEPEERLVPVYYMKNWKDKAQQISFKTLELR